jgi:mono/diheme cytochrome c family protein
MFSTIALVLALPLSATAQDYSFGQAEYMNSCAQCHGPAGKGDGVIAGMLNTAPPDLTQLQKNNGGVFPVAALYRMIDGTEASGAHGSGEMPAWGMRYSFDAPEMLGWDYSDADSRAFVRTRILALIEYLSTMQE